MSELKQVCQSIVKFKDYTADSTKKRILYQKCLNVENAMFKVYLKKGKGNRNNFPFESLGKIIFTNQTEVQKIAKTLFDSGWNPGVHIILTRKKFEKISYIGKSMNY